MKGKLLPPGLVAARRRTQGLRAPTWVRESWHPGPVTPNETRTCFHFCLTSRLYLQLRTLAQDLSHNRDIGSSSSVARSLS